MTNFTKVANVIYSLSHLFNPGSMGWNTATRTLWTGINRDWRKYYSDPDKRIELARAVLVDLNLRFKDKDVFKDDFDGYEEHFNIYIVNLIGEIERYRYNTSDKHVFFGMNRRYRCLQGVTDQEFRYAVADTYYIEPMRLSKKELIWVVETYSAVFRYVVNNFKRKEINVEVLAQLGLPTDKDQLKEAVNNCENLGELFPWHLTDYGFEYWAMLYLDKQQEFKFQLYKYLNRLHPEVKFKELNQGGFIRTDYIAKTTTAGAAAPRRNYVFAQPAEPLDPNEYNIVFGR